MSSPSCVVGVVLRDVDGRVLLDKRSTPPGVGGWAVPGGHVEWRESLAEAAAREVLEETGIVLSPGSLRQLGTYEVIEEDVHVVLVMFTAPVNEGEARAGDWFDLDELQNLPMHETGRVVLSECLGSTESDVAWRTDTVLTKSPRHIGLIPDGTRRWSHANGLLLVEGYRLAMHRIAEFIQIAFDAGTESITIYLLSRQNLNRSPDDLDAVDQAEAYLLTDLLHPMSTCLEFDIVVCGDPESAPPRLNWAIDAVSSGSRHRERTVYLLVAYDPFDELAVTGGQGIEGLWVDQPLDLVIRTSGERRISNFVPLQSGYAEFAFVMKHLNDMSREDWLRVLTDFGARERRFGS